MSFILDALKKSEEHRQQQHPAKVKRRRLRLQPSSRRGRLVWLLWLLLPIGLLTGWLLRGPTSPPLPVDSASQPPAAIRPEPRPAESIEPRLPAPPAPVPKRSESRSAAAPEISAGSGDTRQESGLRVPGPAPDLRSQSEAKDRGAAPAFPESRVEPAAAGQRWPLYTELAPETRDHLPRLSMSLHFFAPESDRRLVRINDRLWREGDWLSEDLQLVEVTTEGALLDYLGLRFELRGLAGRN